MDFAVSKYIEDDGYDKVFCVFDKDRHQSFNAAIQRINGLARRAENPIPIEAITAVPCFELWVLLHYERSSRGMTCAEVVKTIKKYEPKYTKGDLEIIERLLPRTNAAIANSKWLIKDQAASGANDLSTKIHEVVLYLKGLVEPGK